MIKESYRADYPGEFVVINTTWAGGKRTQEREWIPNPIENYHISGRAACIGSAFDFDKFDYTRLQKHRGGLLGSKKLQTYGVGSIATEMRLDFAIETDNNLLQSFIDSEYNKNNIVYTTARNCLAHPGEFYLIPQCPSHTLPIALIVYLAAFDGHQEIFLLGYNDETSIDNPQWINQVGEVLDAYQKVKFFIPGEKTRIPGQWLDRTNCESITYRDFVTYCDV